MSASASRVGAASTHCRGTSTRTARMAERAPIIGLKGVDGNIGDDRTYEHNHVDAGSALPVAEQLPDAPLRSVPPNGPADTSRRDDAEPGHVHPVRQGEQRQVAPSTPRTAPLDPLELRTPPYPLAPGQTALHGRVPGWSPNGDSLAPLRAPALQDPLPRLRAHPLPEAVRAPAPAPIRLIRTLHDPATPTWTETPILSERPNGCQSRLRRAGIHGIVSAKPSRTSSDSLEVSLYECWDRR